MAKTFLKFPTGARAATVSMNAIARSVDWNAAVQPEPDPSEPVEAEVGEIFSPTATGEPVLVDEETGRKMLTDEASGITRYQDYQIVNRKNWLWTERTPNWWTWGTQSFDSGKRAKYEHDDAKAAGYSNNGGVKVESVIVIYEDDGNGNYVNPRVADVDPVEAKLPAGTRFGYGETVTSKLAGTPVARFLSEEIFVIQEYKNEAVFKDGDIVLTPVEALHGRELRCDIRFWPDDSTGTRSTAFAQYSCDGGVTWHLLDDFTRVGWRPLVLPANWGGGDIHFRTLDEDDIPGPVYVYKDAPAGKVGQPKVHVTVEASEGRAVREALPAPAPFFFRSYPEGFETLEYEHLLYLKISFGDPGSFRLFPALHLFGNDRNSQRSNWIAAHAYEEIGSYTVTAEVINPMTGAVGTGTKDVQALDPMEHFSNIYLIDPDGDATGLPAGVTLKTSMEEARAETNNMNVDNILVMLRRGKTFVDRLAQTKVSGDMYAIPFGEGSEMPLIEQLDVQNVFETDDEQYGVALIYGMKFRGKYHSNFDPAVGPVEGADFFRTYGPGGGNGRDGQFIVGCDIDGYTKGFYVWNNAGLVGIFDSIFRGGYNYPMLSGVGNKLAFVGCQMHQKTDAWISGDNKPDYPGNPHVRHDGLRMSFVTDYVTMSHYSGMAVGNWSSRTLPQPDTRFGRSGLRAARVYVSQCTFFGGGPNLMRNVADNAPLPGCSVLVDSVLVAPSSSPYNQVQIQMGMQTWRNVIFSIGDAPKQQNSSTREFLDVGGPLHIWADHRLPVRIYNCSFYDDRVEFRHGAEFKFLRDVPDTKLKLDLHPVLRNNAIIGDAIPNVEADTGFDGSFLLDHPYEGRHQAIPDPEIDDKRTYLYQDFEPEFAQPDISIRVPLAGSSVEADVDASDPKLVAYWDAFGKVRPKGAESRGAVEVGSVVPSAA